MLIDFYILDATDYQKSLYFTCQLLEKIYQDRLSAYVHFNSRDEASQFDHFLWVYRDDSFLPHSLYPNDDPIPPPIQIGFEGIEVKLQGIMVNLATKTPAFYQQFDRLIEIVFSSSPVQQLARDRYKAYRDDGHEIKVHKNAQLM